MMQVKSPIHTIAEVTTKQSKILSFVDLRHLVFTIKTIPGFSAMALCFGKKSRGHNFQN